MTRLANKLCLAWAIVFFCFGYFNSSAQAGESYGNMFEIRNDNHIIQGDRVDELDQGDYETSTPSSINRYRDLSSTPSVDLTGVWKGKANFGARSAALTCYLSQNGSIVTGKCESPGAYPTNCGLWALNIVDGIVDNNIFYFDGTTPTKDVDTCEVVCLDSFQGAVTINKNKGSGNATEESCIDWEILPIKINVTKQPGPTACFEHYGKHDSTTKKRALFGVNTKKVDDHPLAGGLIELDASCSKDSGGQIVKYEWRLDDALLSTSDQKIELPLSYPGSYKVSLTIVDDRGLSDETSEMIDLTLEVGDLIFIRTPGWSTLFDIAVQKYTHVGMYCGNDASGTPIMVEASLLPDHDDPNKGVHTSPLSGWAYPTETFATAYSVVTATPQEKAAACQFVRDPDRIGRGYDNDIFHKQIDGPTYYCSELVWAAYQYATSDRIEGGINLGRTKGDEHVWPDQIANDRKNLKPKSGHWEQYPF